MQAYPAAIGAITDLADQAIMLPVSLVVAGWIASTGWLRGAVGWIAVIGGVLASVAALKILVMSCRGVLRPLGLYSPSGHTVAAALLAGGLAILLCAHRPERTRAAILAAVAAAGAIGVTRILLHAHTGIDVVVALPIGVGGTWLLSRSMGQPPRHFTFAGGALAAALTVMLFYGSHSDIERLLQHAFAATSCPLDTKS